VRRGRRLVLLTAAVTLALAVAALGVALARGSTRTRPSGQGSTEPIGISQWVDGRWQSSGPYKLRAAAVSTPIIGGQRTQRLSSLDAITSNGDIADIRELGSPLREYLYLYSPKGFVVSRSRLQPPMPLSCTPDVLLTNPFIFSCSYGTRRELYALSNGVVWHVGVPSSIEGVIHAQPESDGVVRIVICPLYPSGTSAHIAVVTLAGRSVRSIQVHSVSVPSSAYVVARPDGDSGWLVLTGISTGSESCDELASYDNRFRRLWVRTFSGTCSELEADAPAASGSSVLLGLSAPFAQHDYLISPSGRLVWSSAFVTGAQAGIAGPPVLGVDGTTLCVAGFGDGSFVGESGSPTDVDYAYLARLNDLTGVVEWKARMLSQLESGSQWTLYTPTEVSCSPTSMEVLDSGTNGTRSDPLPVMLLMNSRTT
jgi:hypothetical protein